MKNEESTDVSSQGSRPADHPRDSRASGEKKHVAMTKQIENEIIVPLQSITMPRSLLSSTSPYTARRTD